MNNTRRFAQKAKKNQEREMNLLLEQAYGILKNQDSSWSFKDEELYSLLERVIFLKARENTFREFFDKMEEVIESISRLDFSKRAPLSEISLDKRNILNYAVMCLNIIAEKMESSVVSAKVVNAFCSEMPATIVIVTDKNGTIRFINNLGEGLFGKRSLHVGKSINTLFPDCDKVLRQHKSKDISNHPVTLLSDHALSGVEHFYLKVPAIYDDLTEIEEIVYLFSKHKFAQPQSALHLAHFFSDFFKRLKKDDLYNDIRFDIDIGYALELYVNPILFESLFESLCYLAASKSFRKDSFIQISACTVADGELLIRIHDNGIGLRENEFDIDCLYPSILEKIKKVVADLSASIDCHTQHGRGTTFTLRFPRGVKK
jgi:hypothetical protein